MDANKHCLMIVTVNGQLYSWNVKKQTSNYPPISLPILGTSPSTRLTGVSTRSNGVSMLSCSNAVVYTYDLALGCFTKLADRWWAEGSDAWGWNKQRSAAGTGGGGGGTGGGPKGLEGYCNNIPVESPTTATSVNASNANAGSAVASGDNDDNDDGGEGEERTKKPQWWTEALTLGHLETRMYAAKTLDSPVEYKQALLTYARRVADEGFRWKAEELIRELFGPVYWRPGKDDGWTPTVAGLGKRDLLKEVLSIFARSKTLTKLGVDWQDTLKKAVLEE